MTSRDIEKLYGAIRRLIVAVHEVCDDEQREGEWLSGALAEAHSVLPPIGYRADLARPSQDESVARKARSAALHEVDALVEAFGPKRGNRWINRADLRAALAAMDTPKGGGDA